MRFSKSSSKREVYSKTSLPHETRNMSNNLTLYIKEIEKEEFLDQLEKKIDIEIIVYPITQNEKSIAYIGI